MPQSNPLCGDLRWRMKRCAALQIRWAEIKNPVLPSRIQEWAAVAAGLILPCDAIRHILDVRGYHTAQREFSHWYMQLLRTLNKHSRSDKQTIFALICCIRMLLLQKPRYQSLERRTNCTIRVTLRIHLKKQRQATDALSRRRRSLCSSARCAVDPRCRDKRICASNEDNWHDVRTFCSHSAMLFRLLQYFQYEVLKRSVYQCTTFLCRICPSTAESGEWDPSGWRRSAIRKFLQLSMVMHRLY